MNEIKVYGVIINMDYAHQSPLECKILWEKIAEKMHQENFIFEKRMFLYTTEQLSQDEVCNIARLNVAGINQLNIVKEDVFQYVRDFFAVDMTDYTDLSLQLSLSGIEVVEEFSEQISLN